MNLSLAELFFPMLCGVGWGMLPIYLLKWQVTAFRRASFPVELRASFLGALLVSYGYSTYSILQQSTLPGPLKALASGLAVLAGIAALAHERKFFWGAEEDKSKSD